VNIEWELMRVKLAMRRREMGLSQHALSRELGMNEGYIENMEARKDKYPSARMLFKWANFLGGTIKVEWHDGIGVQPKSVGGTESADTRATD
jgi:transcriptional regulator with XRE-family HTH domain